VSLGPTTVYPLASAISLAEGTPKTYTVTNPSAGSDWSRTVPGEGAWLVNSIVWTFTASAVAGTRQIVLQYTDGNATIFQTATANGVTAGTGPSRMCAAIGASTYVNPGANTGFIVALPAIILDPGSVISTTTAALDVGDTFVSIRLRVMELPLGPTGYVRGPALVDTGSENGG
jgi:hypothetical protein